MGSLDEGARSQQPDPTHSILAAVKTTTRTHSPEPVLPPVANQRRGETNPQKHVYLTNFLSSYFHLRFRKSDKVAFILDKE